MAEFVYTNGTTEFTLGPGLDTVIFPGEAAHWPTATVLIRNFETGATGDRIDLAAWLEAISYYFHYWNPFYGDIFSTARLKLEQDGADTIILIDRRDADRQPGIPVYVPWLRLEGVQASALTLENLGYDPTGGADLHAAGKVATGSAADELVLGSATHDSLDGGGGNDRLLGGRGRDNLSGNDGDDVLYGEGDSDNLYGGAGADQIDGGTGDDALNGGTGDDIMLGGAGNDGLSDLSTDGNGNDLMDGGAGNDGLFSSEAGNDVLIGGAGNDTIRFWRSSLTSVDVNRLDGGEGDDSFLVSAQNRGVIDLDAGTGSDRVDIHVVHQRLNIRFDPDGSDTVILGDLQSQWYGGASIVIEGFARGDSGAVLVWHDFLSRALTQWGGTWDGTANPFATGHARIVTTDGRQYLQIDGDGQAPGYIRVMDLGPDTGAAFTAHNFDGFAPDGSAPVGLAVAGTDAGDELAGRNGSDSIGGGGGDDNLFGRAGSDSINGGAGNDYVEGGPGADLIEGGEGADMMLGGQGDDIVHGGAGNDRLEENWVTGAGGSDSLYGEEGDDFFLYSRDRSQAAGNHYLSGGDGNDWMLIGIDNAGVATLDGGAGDDRIRLSNLRYGASAVVTLGPGQDRLELGGGRFHDLYSTSVTVTDFAPGDSGDLIVFENSLSSWLTGWSGGNPFASGHFGLSPAAGGAKLRVDGNGGGDGFITLLTLVGVDPLALTAANLGGWAPPIVSFSDSAEQIGGTSGSDLFRGLGGADLFLLQQGGDDAASGGAGNDIIYFGGAFTGDDRADGGADRDALILQGNYALTLSATNLAGIESLSLQSGAQTRWGDTANNFYDYDIAMVDSNTPAGVQLIVNAQSLREGEDFTFDGSAESDGRFLVYAGHGVDDLAGGAGNDVFFFEGQRWGADDRVDGGGGRDAVIISSGSGVNRFEFGEASFANIESISLNARYASDPTQKPSYEIVLANGNVAPGATLIVNGSSIADSGQFVSVDGSAVQAGNLTLLGGAGNDTLKGGGGADLLYGAGGGDTLAGGAQADSFQYRSAAESAPGGADSILDFEVGLDKLDLRFIDADTLESGDQAFAFIGSSAFTGAGAGSAGELRVQGGNGSWFVEGDTDGDGDADFVVGVTASNQGMLTQGDFLL